MRKHKNSRRYTESKANARCLLESKNKRYARVCVRGGFLLERKRKRERKKRETKTQCDIFRVSQNIVGFKSIEKVPLFCFSPLFFIVRKDSTQKRRREAHSLRKNTTTFTTTTTALFFLLLLLPPKRREEEEEEEEEEEPRFRERRITHWIFEIPSFLCSFGF